MARSIISPAEAGTGAGRRPVGVYFTRLLGVTVQDGGTHAGLHLLIQETVFVEITVLS